MITQEFNCTAFNDMLGCNGGYHGNQSKNIFVWQYH